MKKYLKYIDQIFSACAEMHKNGLLDCTGGAVSIRADDGNIVISSTGASDRGWKPDESNITVITADGSRIGPEFPFAASGTPVHLELYKQCQNVGAVLHTHAPNLLAFASLGVSAPNMLNLTDALGEVPCLLSKDAEIKARVMAGIDVPHVPTGIAQRPDVYAVNQKLIEQVLQQFSHRFDALPRRPLGFLLQRHGAVTFASELRFAVNAMYRIESSCRTALMSTLARQFLESTRP